MAHIYQVILSPGDGVGHETIGWAQKILETAAAIDGGFDFRFSRVDVGMQAYRKRGQALTAETLAAMRGADATLLVAIAAAEIPRNLPNPIIVMRKELDLYANIRPLRDYAGLAPKGRKADLIVLRENTEGIYSGIEYNAGQDAACAVRLITRQASARIARVAFDLARKRRKKVTIVHKVTAHRLTDGLFLDTVEKIGREEFPDIAMERMLVDAVAMHLVRDPMHFDVILATNAYGDILSDEAAQITGGISLAPAANIGEETAVFEPAHGSAPDIAGRGIVNPAATILAAALMLDHLGERDAGRQIQKAVASVIESKAILTADLGGDATTDQMGAAIVQALK